MLRCLDDYVDIVGPEVIYSVLSRVCRLYKKRICHINATFLGGGVAEILGRLVPLMNEVGLLAEWQTIHGSPAFFDVTKRFHNALQRFSDVIIQKFTVEGFGLTVTEALWKRKPVCKSRMAKPVISSSRMTTMDSPSESSAF
jgi:hypothetical protein